MHTKLPSEKNYQESGDFGEMMELWSAFRDTRGGKTFSMEGYLENYYHMEPIEAKVTAHRVRIQTKHFQELYTKHRRAALREVPTTREYLVTPAQDPTLTGWECFQRFHQIVVRFYRKIQDPPTALEISQAQEREARQQARAEEQARKARKAKLRWLKRMKATCTGHQLELGL